MHKEEGRREKRSERWRKSYLLEDVHLDQCIVNSFSWPFCSHPRCLALRSDYHTNSLGSSRDPALRRKILLQSLNTISWMLREESSVVPKKKNAADWDPLIP